jgi:predicted anti-sigma-YlaC factor YlaD
MLPARAGLHVRELVKLHNGRRHRTGWVKPRMAALNMNCQEVIEFLDSYCDGDLSPEQRGRFEQHLSICPDCVKYLNSYRRTIELARSPHEQGSVAPRDIPEDLVRAILRSRK